MADKMEERIQALEEMVAHQDATIQDLSDVISKQWDSLQSYSVVVERLKARMSDIEDSVEQTPEANVKPPHW